MVGRSTSREERDRLREQRRRDWAARAHLGTGPVTGALNHPNADRQLARTTATLGTPIEIDPGEALLQEVHRTAGHVRWLGERIAMLEPDELIWNRTAEIEEHGTGAEGGFSSTKTETRAELHRTYDLYERERKHLAAVSAMAIKAGIEERRVRLVERGVDAIETALTLALTDLGHDPNDAAVRRVIGARLRETFVIDSGGERFVDDAAYTAAADLPTASVDPKRTPPRPIEF